ncbi:MAG: 50S ribosomal protein L9 [Elusimicrobiota bacterium]|jgi:large subunit ribosomal protein L9|nr:50S ribosomal protein L9 [Elusimicrobiota bacterium]
MKVILRYDITNVGRQGDVKDVSAGYVRNYLIPKKLVMEANARNLKVWEREKSKMEKVRQEVIDKAKELAQQLETQEFQVHVKIGDNGKIFGSVTHATLAQIFAENGFEVNKHDILLAANIKELGSYEINVRLHPEVSAKAKFIVIGDKE